MGVSNIGCAMNESKSQLILHFSIPVPGVSNIGCAMNESKSQPPGK